MGGELLKIRLYRTIGSQSYEDLVRTIERVQRAMQAESIKAYRQDPQMQRIDFYYDGIQIRLSELTPEVWQKSDGLKIEMQKETGYLAILYQKRNPKELYICCNSLEEEVKNAIVENLQSRSIREKISRRVTKV